jgi:hypothetical protein
MARAEWNAPSHCIQHDRLSVLVAGALGESIPPEVAIDGAIEGNPGAWRATVRVALGGGEGRSRVLTSDDDNCHRLDDALGVIAALLVDEVRARAEPAPLVIEPTPPPPPGWMAILRVIALARIDALPGLAGAGGLELEIRSSSGFSIALGLAGWPPVEARRDGLGGRFVAMSATIAGCYAHAIIRELELGGCLEANAMYLRGEGIGLTSPGTSEGVLFDVALSAMGRIQIFDQLWIRVSAGAAFPIIRPRSSFRTAGGEKLVHESSIVVPEASFGLEARF